MLDVTPKPEENAAMTTTDSPFQIRDATLADAETIVEFNRLLALESENKNLDPRVLGRGVRLALERPELCRYFLAEVEGRIVGQTMRGVFAGKTNK